MYDSEILMEEYEDTPTVDKQTQADHDLQIEEEAVEKKELEYDTPDDDLAHDVPEGETGKGSSKSLMIKS